MRSIARRARPLAKPRFSIPRGHLVAALLGTALCGFVPASAATELNLVGAGTFKPPTTEQLADLPADLPFLRSDLLSGKWLFVVRYEDRSADVDADPYVGRYGGAIRHFSLTIGDTTVALPVDQAELVVSDGGVGFRQRESIRLETRAATAAGAMRVGWIQLNQRSNSDDLRGALGSLPDDSMPAPATLANLSAASPFDRFFYLRIDRPGEKSQPVLYLSSSKVAVVASDPTAAR